MHTQDPLQLLCRVFRVSPLPCRQSAASLASADLPSSCTTRGPERPAFAFSLLDYKCFFLPSPHHLCSFPRALVIFPF